MVISPSGALPLPQGGGSSGGVVSKEVTGALPLPRGVQTDCYST